MEERTRVESLKGRIFSQLLSIDAYKNCVAALIGRRSEAVMLLNDRGTVLYCNAEWESIGGYSSESMVGSCASDFVHGLRLNPDRPGANVVYADHLGCHNHWNEHRIIDSRGREFSMELLLDVLVVNLRYMITLRGKCPGHLIH